MIPLANSGLVLSALAKFVTMNVTGAGAISPASSSSGPVTVPVIVVDPLVFPAVMVMTPMSAVAVTEATPAILEVAE